MFGWCQRQLSTQTVCLRVLLTEMSQTEGEGPKRKVPTISMRVILSDLGLSHLYRHFAQAGLQSIPKYKRIDDLEANTILELVESCMPKGVTFTPDERCKIWKVSQVTRRYMNKTELDRWMRPSFLSLFPRALCAGLASAVVHRSRVPARLDGSPNAPQDLRAPEEGPRSARAQQSQTTQDRCLTTDHKRR